VSALAICVCWAVGESTCAFSAFRASSTMIFRVAVVSALVAQVAAFSAPVSVVGGRTSAVTMQMTDFSWRQRHDGKPAGSPITGLREKEMSPAEAASAPADLTKMTTAQACVFMQSPALNSVSIADKIAFLESQGVSTSAAVQASCVAPAFPDNVQGRE